METLSRLSNGPFSPSLAWTELEIVVVVASLRETHLSLQLLCTDARTKKNGCLAPCFLPCFQRALRWSNSFVRRSGWGWGWSEWREGAWLVPKKSPIARLRAADDSSRSLVMHFTCSKEPPFLLRLLASAFFSSVIIIIQMIRQRLLYCRSNFFHHKFLRTCSEILWTSEDTCTLKSEYRLWMGQNWIISLKTPV